MQPLQAARGMKGARFHAMGSFGRAEYLIQQFPFLTFSYPKSGNRAYRPFTHAHSERKVKTGKWSE
jgi:hypothetical protein